MAALVKFGANLEARDIDGHTPLYIYSLYSCYLQYRRTYRKISVGFDSFILRILSDIKNTTHN